MNDAQRRKLEKELKELKQEIVDSQRQLNEMYSKMEGLWRKQSQLEMLLAR